MIRSPRSAGRSAAAACGAAAYMAAAILSPLPAAAAPASAAPAAAIAAAAGAAAAVAADPRATLAQADELRFAEDWYGAIDYYLAVVAHNAYYGEAYVGLAECYYQLGEYDQALSFARKAAPLRKADRALADLEGFIRLGSGDLSGARASFQSVLAALPNDIDARFGLALLDLAAGRKTEARSRLEESLRLSPQNGRALLSLALIAQDQGKAAESKSLAEKALRYHGGEAKTQLVAARLAASDGDSERAAFHARNALEIRPSYAEARLLLGSLLFDAGSYDESVSLMREAVARDRGDGLAWYTLGMAQSGAGRTADAVYSLRTALAARPDDEIGRLALENLVVDSSPVEDSSRAAYADWHIFRGSEFEERSVYEQALFEYRRALRIDPYSTKGRTLYAKLLRARGFPGKYLTQLEFLASIGKADRGVLDAIETYADLLSDSVGKLWGIDEETLPKRPYKLALMYIPSSTGRFHAAFEETIQRYAKELFASSSRASILPLKPRVASFAEAFRAAREAEADYFVLLSSRETEREIEIVADMRVGRTGSAAASYSAYRTGNDRVKDAAARIVELLGSSLAPQGKLCARRQDRAFVDLGAAEGVVAGAKLLVLKKGSLAVKPEGLGLGYAPKDIIGEIEVSLAGEEASEGRLKSSGYFDTVNIGDHVILAPAAQASPGAPGSAPAGAAAGVAGGTGASGGTGAAGKPAAEKPREWPGLFSAVQRLR